MRSRSRGHAGSCRSAVASDRSQRHDTASGRWRPCRGAGQKARRRPGCSREDIVERACGGHVAKAPRHRGVSSRSRSCSHGGHRVAGRHVAAASSAATGAARREPRRRRRVVDSRRQRGRAPRRQDAASPRRHKKPQVQPRQAPVPPVARAATAHSRAAAGWTPGRGEALTSASQKAAHGVRACRHARPRPKGSQR